MRLKGWRDSLPNFLLPSVKELLSFMQADVRVARHGRVVQIAFLSFSWINPFGLEEYRADLFNIHALFKCGSLGWRVKPFPKQQPDTSAFWICSGATSWHIPRTSSWKGSFPIESTKIPKVNTCVFPDDCIFLLSSWKVHKDEPLTCSFFFLVRTVTLRLHLWIGPEDFKLNPSVYQAWAITSRAPNFLSPFLDRSNFLWRSEQPEFRKTQGVG